VKADSCLGWVLEVLFAMLEGLSVLKAAAVWASAQFFIFLALKRGIVQSKQVPD
jgi:hypothetical protein